MNHHISTRNIQFRVLSMSVRYEPDFHALVAMLGKELIGDCLERGSILA